MDRFAYVEPSMDRYAYVEQRYLLLVVSRKEKLEKMDSAVEVFSNVNSNMQQYSAMMTTALLLKESRISNHDVSIFMLGSARAISAMMTSVVMSSQSAVDKKRKRYISDDDVSQQSTRSARAISAMMTSAVMSSQSAVDKKRKSWISDDDISSDVITISSELQYIQSLATVQPVVGKVEGSRIDVDLVHLLPKVGIQENSRKLMRFQNMLDYDYAGPNPKHASKGKKGGGGSKIP
ncbi:hypothetical protein F511_07637 [Dorcoceras hygrometricum]|uniref:Uncharacterized protein n=1 Tax=Dorcoceras hygrometricum TaxID=472368 RepID=A0A2Z7DGE8_9LAMI|nr:hypothetical protein F511_07637 [Dorcoceras hygrometricum]